MWTPRPPRRRKHFGMTGGQIAILAGMGTLNCAVLGLAAALLLGRSAPTSVASNLATQPRSPTATITPTPTLEPGWVLIEKPEEGFAIALPPTWVEVDMRAPTMKDAIDAIRTQHPDLTSTVLNYLETLDINELHAQGIIFVAFDRELPGGLASNFGVNVNLARWSDGQDIAMDEVVEIYLETLASHNITAPRHSRVSLQVGEAEKFQYQRIESYPDGQMLNVNAVQYIFIRGQDVYVLTLGYTEEQAEVYASIAEKIAQGLRRLE